MEVILIFDGTVALTDGHLPQADLHCECDFRFEADGGLYGVLYVEQQLPGYEWVELRRSWQILGDKLWNIVAKGAELIDFDRTTRFCRRCGGPLHRHSEISKKCDTCGAEYFPPMNTAIMVLVEDRQGRALMVHAANFRGPFYGLVAGFVETGETLEECVRREVKEETNLDICDIEYVESQSWPFPSQLMIGFHARLAEDSDELRFADGELTAGDFFSRDNLPPIATPPGLAHKLIQRWLK
ncbi:MAG: NAD(+) diphosphatase [Clostridium sp.]|nr:NAD(+) diphosphatase [Prevotella sp.]MCM1429050.1 NAD(+) diphosphatase [Clostridium sp.]MCM1475419.1 NAD(+) diphosphatase [Muribaculaceae bacterium]